MLKKITGYLKKELMLTVSVAAAVAALIITPPSLKLLEDIDWKTLATLFMMLTVLEGFKKENIFRPVIRLAGRLKTMRAMSFFLIFGVFFSSMFVTNDVSLIIFVPLTIMIFRDGGKEKYILPVISMENIAAVRGSMLTPFGSPQNLFIFAQSGIDAGTFILHMLPLWIFSGLLLCGFICFLYRKDPKESILSGGLALQGEWALERKRYRICYLCLFALVLFTIVSRTALWPYITLAVVVAVVIFDVGVLKRTDYVLLLTFLCFFIFSSSITSNAAVSGFLSGVVSGYEYVWGILLSQVISNVPASIVLYPFTTNIAGLLYGVDSAGLVFIIGSLASVINYRIYVKEYPGNGKAFIKYFTLISLAFFAIVVVPGYFLSYWKF